MALLAGGGRASLSEDAYRTASNTAILKLGFHPETPTPGFFVSPHVQKQQCWTLHRKALCCRSSFHAGKASASLGTSQWMEMERLQEGAGSAEKRIPSEELSSPSKPPDSEAKLGLGLQTHPSDTENVERNPRLYENHGKAEKNPRFHDLVLPARLFQGKYGRELDVAVRAVQLACILTQRTQERILRNEEKADSKTDRSLVTVADWGVQAVISWVLSQTFCDEEVYMIAEEDTAALKGMDGIHMLQRVVSAVNECLSSSSVVGLNPPDHPLCSIDVLKAINKGSSTGGPKGKYWVLDPVDGTLGFVRGDQYAIALSMIEDGEVVLGVLGCPNFPMRKEWLCYHHKYYRLLSKLSPPSPNVWHKGCIFTAQKGGRSWMQPLIWNLTDLNIMKMAKPVSVSLIDDPAEASFCEPVEKANSSHSFTAGLASSIGLKKHPLRVYSMAKYGAIARGDAEIFMKFARSGYKEKIWDHAAGVLIVQEAGGVVTDAGGKPLDFSQGRYLEGLDRGIIACSGKMLHDKLMEAVDASWDSSRL